MSETNRKSAIVGFQNGARVGATGVVPTGLPTESLNARKSTAASRRPF
jgi:hypothetical protein